MTEQEKLELFAKAEKDRRIKSALPLFKDIINMISKNGGNCFISADFFCKKYNIARRTFFYWKSLLVKSGYIDSEKGFLVQLKRAETLPAGEAESPENRDEKLEICARSCTGSAKNCADNEEIQPTFEQEVALKSARSCTDSARNCTHKLNKQIKQINPIGGKQDFLVFGFLEFGHIKLADHDYSRLKEAYGKERTEEAMARMDCYLEANGKRYKNYYAALRNWLAKERHWLQQKNGGRHSGKKSPWSDYELTDEDII